MKHSILKFGLFLATLTMSVSLFGQNGKELLKEMPSRAGSIYHSYEVPEIHDTKAPKGYKAFYISHYGRHGSRYHTSGKFFTTGQDVLDKAAKEGILTTTGKELKTDFDAIVAMHDGMFGELTQKGGAEHQGISTRMYNRFPQVFNQKNRQDVKCVASTIQRCIISMNFFSSTLKGINPDLNFHFYTGKRFMNYIIHESSMKDYRKANSQTYDSLLNVIFDPTPMLKRIFTDQEKAKKILNGKAMRFCTSVYFTGCICEDMDNSDINIFKYLTQDELYKMWIGYNAKMYLGHSNSHRYGRQAGLAGRHLLKDIVDKADEAIAGNSKAADLRFGHDTGLLPLINLINIDCQNVFVPINEIDKYWLGFQVIPMASNIQFVFFKNKKNDVLVKILYNEKETTLPELKPFEGPFYKWNDLKEYFKNLYKDIEK